MSQLSIEVIYYDDDLIELEARATNNRYAGVTRIYLGANWEDFIDLGNRLKGFPKNTEQIEEIEFGFTKRSQEEFQKIKANSPMMKPFTAYLGLKFYCTDGAGHPAVLVALQEDNIAERSERNGNACFEIRFEPAQIDKFSEEIIEIRRNKKGTATLTGIKDGTNPYILEIIDP
jgi:hypothetical protein